MSVTPARRSNSTAAALWQQPHKMADISPPFSLSTIEVTLLRQPGMV
jgi:hypothetical protein